MSSVRSCYPPQSTALYITGLGSQYPPYLLGPDTLSRFAERFHDIQCPGLQRLLQINASAGIETRASIKTYETGFACESIPPSITDFDQVFRKDGVDLAVKACNKAMAESRITARQITHTVGVTCTNQGHPGYDLLVNERLGLSMTTDRLLLHGVGCAGGISIMRAAAQLAHGATLREKPAYILAYACEICTLNIRHELAEAEKCTDLNNLSIAGALFSDAAAAFVLCNQLALEGLDVSPLFELIEWGSTLIPNTIQQLECYTGPNGFHVTLTREVPKYAKEAIGPMFENLLPMYERQLSVEFGRLGTADFDWAVHPGGKAVLEGVKEVLGLTEDQLRASREIYRTRGNSSSPTIISVLDKLRTYKKKREHIVAAAFGPGMLIEMALLKRCEAAGVNQDTTDTFVENSHQ